MIKTPADKSNKDSCTGSFKGHVLTANAHKLLSEERLISDTTSQFLA